MNPTATLYGIFASACVLLTASAIAETKWIRAGIFFALMAIFAWRFESHRAKNA